MKMTVSQAMVECLKAENVKVVFGYPGAAICPFYDALLDAENDIRQLTAMHEFQASLRSVSLHQVRVQLILLLLLLPLMRILYLSCA